jgi:hypothetical protein
MNSKELAGTQSFDGTLDREPTILIHHPRIIIKSIDLVSVKPVT